MSLRKFLKRNQQILTINDKLKEFYYKKLISEKGQIQNRFKKRVGHEVNLDNPTKFNEKLQWLKLNWYDPIATKCADKYGVREFVKEKIGEEYLNEIYAVYESVEEIEIDKLPKSFVLKATHGSGFNLICNDKNEINWDKTFKVMRRWLKRNYYWENREWVYKDIKPRIICEKFLTEDSGNLSLTDYKFFCFNGQPKYCQVIRGRNENQSIDFYDTEWNHMSFSGLFNNNEYFSNSPTSFSKPKNYDKMLSLSKKLSKTFPFVRVDFYLVEEKIYFGELTFFPLSGYGYFYPREWDRKIGDMLELPLKKD